MADIKSQNTDATESAPSATEGIDTGGAATPPADTGAPADASQSVADAPAQGDESTLSADYGQSSASMTPEPGTDAPVKRKPGRPRKEDVAARLNSVTPPPPKPTAAPVAPPAPIVVANYEAMGAMAANLFFNSGELLLGYDWVPETGEPVLIKNAFRDYFQSENLMQISPAWVLGITLFSYSAKRITKPTIKTRIVGAYQWLKSKTPFKR